MPRLAVLLALGFGAALAAETMRTEAAGLRFAVPSEWTRVPATSDVRAAQYRVPRAAGDQEDGEIVLFFFGQSKGGGVEENLARWYGQFTQADGKPSRDAAVVTTRTVNGLKVTLVDLAGSYKGMGPDEKAKPGYRMLAAVVEGKGGPWFFKAVGPAATVGQAKAAFVELVGGLEPHA
jgi:hypothetical protein